MDITYSYVAERDIDLLVLEEFLANKDFAKIFLNKVGISNFKIISAYHSLLDPVYGESDITIIIECEGMKIGILIEDKIDAIAMDQQADRYIERANLGVLKKEYYQYFIFIIAPSRYLQSNNEAKKYPNQISYEELRSYFESKDDVRSSVKHQLLITAINKQAQGYTPIEDELITQFWSQLYQYQETNYPDLMLKKIKGPRGANATWLWFDTAVKGVKIAYKSNKGYIDLTLKDQNLNSDDIITIIKPNLASNMSVLKVGKSMVIRMVCPVIDFRNEFQSYSKQIESVLDSIRKFHELILKHKKSFQSCRDVSNDY